jgi:hypothetical protein
MNGIQGSQKSESAQSATALTGTEIKMTHAEYQRRWRRLNKESVRLTKERYKEKNKERLALYRETWLLSNAQKMDKYRNGWDIRNREKYLAHRVIANKIYRGVIVKPDKCEECETIGVVHGHHDDYSKPTKVKWLCVKCHQEKHKGDQS